METVDINTNSAKDKAKVLCKNFNITVQYYKKLKFLGLF